MEILTSDTKQITEYRTIDGNWCRQPLFYCTRYKGYLTAKQMKVHHCQAKHGGMCGRLQKMKGECVRRMKTEVYYDKMIDRMDKLISALNKASRALDKFGRLLDDLEEMGIKPPVGEQKQDE